MVLQSLIIIQELYNLRQIINLRIIFSQQLFKQIQLEIDSERKKYNFQFLNGVLVKNTWICISLHSRFQS